MLSKKTKQWKTSLAVVGMTCMMLGNAPAWASDSTSAAYCQENDQIFWFITITDTHIGICGDDDTKNLSWVVHEGKNVINPSFIVLAGDITDSTDCNFLGWPNGPHQNEWNEYLATLDITQTGINAGNFFDIPGNHDAYDDGDFSFYLANSVQGKATKQTQASWIREFDYGKYHFLGVNTSANDGKKFSLSFPFGDNAGLDEGELAYIQSELSKHSNSDLTLVFGHHPMEDTDHNDDTWLFYGAPEFAALLQDNGVSSYTYGHTHRFSEAFFTEGEEYVEDGIGPIYTVTPGVFYININSLGESIDNHFNVTAIDCNGISMVTQEIKNWPVVMITAPMDRNLGKNAHPLLDYTIPNGTGNPLRALLFDPAISAYTIEYCVDGGTVCYPMNKVPENPNLWEAAWDTSSLSEGEHTVEVHAIRSEVVVRTDTISVYVDAGTTNIPPVANATAIPLSGTAPLKVDFNGTTSTDDGEIVTYLWDFDDGSTTDSGSIVTHTYPNEGTYIVTLTVTDNEGAQTTSASITISVTSVPNNSPVAVATADKTSGTAPLEVHFDGSGSTDYEGPIASYSWDFGDENTGSSAITTHTYPNEGIYSVTLTVTDNEGAQNTSVPITINVDAGSVSYKDQFVSGEIPVSGTVSGSFSDTKVLDGVYETITERVSGGKPSNRYSYLEHVWTVPVEAGATMTLFAQLLPSNSTDGDKFEFAYSTDNINYVPMFTTSGSNLMVYSASLPSNISGTLYVRVIDTDRTAGNQNLDSIKVDQLYIRTGFEAGEVPNAPTALVVNAISSSQIELSWSDNSDNELGFKIERLDKGSWVEVGRVGVDVLTYSDTGLQPVTDYSYRISAYNGSGDSVYSSVETATTKAVVGITLGVQTSKVRGSYFADLEWSGATTLNVDIYKDGSKLTTETNNIGGSTTYSDSLGKKPAGSYEYQVCEADSDICSGTFTVSF